MKNDRDQRRLRSAREQILREIKDRLESGARRFLDAYNCLPSRAGIDVDELVQIGRVAADSEVLSVVSDWDALDASALVELRRRAIVIGVLRIRSAIVDFFRRSDTSRAYATEIAAQSMSCDVTADPEMQAVCKDAILGLSQDSRTGPLVRVILASKTADTKSAYAKALGVDESTVRKVQTVMKKRFFDP